MIDTRIQGSDSLQSEEALANLTLRARALSMSEPVVRGALRESLMTAAYDINLSLEWLEVRARHGGLSDEFESELLVLALELSVLEHEWFCGDHQEGRDASTDSLEEV